MTSESDGLEMLITSMETTIRTHTLRTRLHGNCVTTLRNSSSGKPPRVNAPDQWSRGAAPLGRRTKDLMPDVI